MHSRDFVKTIRFVLFFFAAKTITITDKRVGRANHCRNVLDSFNVRFFR